jgi:hypothetical protein
MDMTNIAYTPEYQAKRKQWEAVFTPENAKDTETIALAEGYTARRRKYRGEGRGHNHRASETALISPNGAEVYRWRNISDEGEFAELIRHSNGGLYLLFRIDLYGYGVLELTGGKTFFHVPQKTETFIWTDVRYNPANDMLVVFGCFWGSPNSLHLLCFRDPLSITPWADVIDLLEGGYDRYDDVDFLRWDGDDLVVKTYEYFGKDNRTLHEIVIPRERYMAGLNEKRNADSGGGGLMK